MRLSVQERVLLITALDTAIKYEESFMLALSESPHEADKLAMRNANVLIRAYEKLRARVLKTSGK